MRMQPQGFARCQPRTPQAETLAAVHPPFLRRPQRPHLMRCCQPTATCGEFLQVPQSLPDVDPWFDLRGCAPLQRLHDLMPGEGLLLRLLPEPAEGRQGNRGGIQGPADAPLPACDPTPEGLFLSKTEQGKTAHLSKIVGNPIVGRSVCRTEGPLGRRAILPEDVFAGGHVPGGMVRGERTEDVVVRSRGAPSILGLE